MAAANVAFVALLGRLGYNEQTSAVIQDDGYDTIEALAGLDEKTAERMVKNLSKANQDDDDVKFTTHSTTNLLGFVFWAKERERFGAEIAAPMFTAAVLRDYKELRSQDRELEDADGATAATTPAKLVTFRGWPKFKDMFETYLGQIRGVSHCSLLYVIREEEAVGQDELVAEYETREDRCVRCTIHYRAGAGGGRMRTSWYEADNRRVWDELKGLTRDGEAWPFMQQFNSSRDGRRAWEALKRQAEGDASLSLRKARAYAAIRDAKYVGERRNFGFRDYVNKHLTAHNELEDVGVPVDERKKVVDFLAGIQDPRLQVAVNIVRGDTEKKNNFFIAQAYLTETALDEGLAAPARPRGVGAVTSGNGGGGGNGGGNGRGKRKQRIHSGNYSPQEWRALTHEEKEQVKELRKNAKRSRNASAATTDQTRTQPEQTAPAEDAGNQFASASRDGATKGRF